MKFLNWWNKFDFKIWRQLNVWEECIEYIRRLEGENGASIFCLESSKKGGKILWIALNTVHFIDRVKIESKPTAITSSRNKKWGSRHVLLMKHIGFALFALWFRRSSSILQNVYFSKYNWTSFFSNNLSWTSPSI